MKRRSLKFYQSRLIALFILVLLAAALFSCRSTTMINKKSVLGIWVGGAYELDQDEFQPFTKVVEFNAAGQFLEWSASANKVDTFDYDFNIATLHIDTFEYDIFDINRLDDELHWGRRFTRFYKKINPAIGLDSTEIRDWLTRQSWRLDETLFQFEKNGRYRSKDDNGADCMEHCFRFASFKDHLFLVKSGNHLECGTYPQFLEQIIQANDREIEVVRWEGAGFKTVTYQAVQETLACQAETPFQLCNKYLYINYPPHRYYYKGTVYQGGLYVINKIFKQNYQPPENSVENGLIRVRFVVNCEGKAGMFEFLGMDYDYQVKTFDPQISEQILTITKTLQDWIPGKNDGIEIDTYKYLTFKIKNGEITEIFP